MFQSKRFLLFLLTVVLLINGIFPIQAAEKDEVSIPSVGAKAAVLMDADSGSILFEKEADLPLPMASTTKIMTALTAIRLSQPETIVQVDARAVGIEGSSVYLVAGETLTLSELLKSLLLESANDAAVAIAVGLCGSVESFVDEMNANALLLGLKHTHFDNPHGLDGKTHFTTASDLALMAQALLQDPILSEIVSCRKCEISHADGETTRLLVNHNKMLRTYDGCIGVKTGFTKTAGRCLVSAAEKDGVRLIAVTLNDPDDWNDHTALLNYGFSIRKSVTLCEEEEWVCPLPVTGGTETQVIAVNKTALHVSLPAACGKITHRIEAGHFLYAPVSEGQTVGRVVFLADTDFDGKEEIIGEVPLVLQSSVASHRKKGFFVWLKQLFS